MPSSAHPRKTASAPGARTFAPTTALEAPPEAPVLGVPLALIDYERTMEWMDAMVRSGKRGYVVAAAVHCVMVCQEDEEMREAVLGASLTVPDGQPLKWALNALGHDLSDRVYGPELMARYFERSAATGVRMYLYGGRNQGALVQLARNLRLRHPGIQIVGGYSPPFRALPADAEPEVAREINHSGADVVWVGIGVPKQEKWMAHMRDKLVSPLLVGVGAAFDFHADLVPQAPNWMQTLGLEWLYRLVQEPRRLWRRYLRYNPRFVFGFLKQYAGHLRARRRSPER